MRIKTNQTTRRKSMPKSQKPPLKIGTPVEIDIAQRLAVAQGVITAADYDDGWMYKINITSGDDCREHRNEAGELWVNDFEVKPIENTPPENHPTFFHTIEIVDDLMVVLDEDGNGHDCHVLASLAEAQDQLKKWKVEYSFDFDEALAAIAEYFSAQ
jgi:hypothetical protein